MKFFLALLATCGAVGHISYRLNSFFEYTLGRGKIPEGLTGKEVDKLVKHWFSGGQPFCIEGKWKDNVETCDFPFKVIFVDLDVPSAYTDRPTHYPTPNPTKAPIYYNWYDDEEEEATILVDLRDVVGSPDFFVDALARHVGTNTRVYCMCGDNVDCRSHLLFHYYNATIVFDSYFIPDVIISEGPTNGYEEWEPVVEIPALPAVEPCLRVVSGSSPEVTDRLTRMMDDLSRDQYYQNKGNDHYLDEIIDGYDQVNIIDTPREIIPYPAMCDTTSLFYIWVDPTNTCEDVPCVKKQLVEELEYIKGYSDVVVVDFDEFVYRTGEIIRPLVLALGRANFDIRSFPDFEFFEMEYDMTFDHMSDWMSSAMLPQLNLPADVKSLYDEIKSNLI